MDDERKHEIGRKEKTWDVGIEDIGKRFITQKNTMQHIATDYTLNHGHLATYSSSNCVKHAFLVAML